MDHDNACEVLGVKPGVSNRELKAAHRDLAKVWHPDRFLHDPRLQEKALEKLKEINEAYELLISGKTPRPGPTQAVYSQPPRQTPRRRSGSWAFVLLMFAGVFAVTTKVLLDRRMHQTVQEPEVVEQPQQPESAVKVVDRTPRPNKEEGPAPEVANNETVATTPTTALATVTVTVDPETGLLAKPECRLRSRMTYPSGSEPTAYCNLSHTPPPKESRVKSIAKSVKRALD